jgi:hypothetical protein
MPNAQVQPRSGQITSRTSEQWVAASSAATPVGMLPRRPLPHAWSRRAAGAAHVAAARVGWRSDRANRRGNGSGAPSCPLSCRRSWAPAHRVRRIARRATSGRTFRSRSASETHSRMLVSALFVAAQRSSSAAGESNKSARAAWAIRESPVSCSARWAAGARRSASAVVGVRWEEVGSSS